MPILTVPVRGQYIIAVVNEKEALWQKVLSLFKTYFKSKEETVFCYCFVKPHIECGKLLKAYCKILKNENIHHHYY